MTDDQEPIDPASASGESSQAPATKKSARKAVKRVSKKAVRKTAKKAAKKVAKKAAQKAAKKVAKKAVKKSATTGAEVSPPAIEPIDEQDLALAEAAEAERAAIAAAEAAARAAEVARQAAEKAASVALEAKKKVASKVAKEAAVSEEPDQASVDHAKDASSKKSLEVVDKKKEHAVEIAVVREKDRPDEEVPADLKEKEDKAPRKEETPPPPPPEVPEEVALNEFRTLSLADLHEELERLPVRIPNQATRAQLIFTILTCYAAHGTRITGEGILEMSGSGYGMIRDELRSFRNSPDDLHLAANFIEDHGLRPGQRIRVLLREPRNRDKYLSVAEVLEIEGIPAADYTPPRHFDQLTSLFPEERFVLEGGDDASLATRVVDLIAPLGKGQRGLIVAPPRGGKTILLKQIARSIQRNSPAAELVVLLLDERPEEVTDFEEMVGRNVFASTFDEASKRHAEVADLVLERSRRLVEQGKDVVILLDSLTRLARGYNNASRGGPIGSGGVSPKAITETRKFFGAARNVEEGGSLTILATCLVETESRMDDVIFEELKGTGNMEVRLDRELAELRIYPAIHIPQSGTRNDDRLYHPDELPRVQEIRRHLASLPIGDAIETLLRNLARTKSNTELLLQGMR